MRKWLLTLGLAICGVVLLVALSAFAVYRATQQVPEQYTQALDADAQAQANASDEMLARATALASAAKKEGDWHVAFTAEQINGWLAVDMVKNHPNVLPPAAELPRVVIESGRLTLFCRYRNGGWTSVLSLVVDAYLAEPNVVALRIRRARAGQLPLPLDRVLDTISEAARRAGLSLRWRQAEGDPVALISIPPPRDAHDDLIRIDTLELRQDEVYLAGSTESR